MPDIKQSAERVGKQIGNAVRRLGEDHPPQEVQKEERVGKIIKTTQGNFRVVKDGESALQLVLSPGTDHEEIVWVVIANSPLPAQEDWEKEFTTLTHVWGNEVSGEELFYEDENGAIHFTKEGHRGWPNNLKSFIRSLLSRQITVAKKEDVDYLQKYMGAVDPTTVAAEYFEGFNDAIKALQSHNTKK